LELQLKGESFIIWFAGLGTGEKWSGGEKQTVKRQKSYQAPKFKQMFFLQTRQPRKRLSLATSNAGVSI